MIKQHVPDSEAMAKLADYYEADFVVDATGMNQARMNDDSQSIAHYGAVGYLELPEGWSHGIRSRDTGPERKWHELKWGHSISQKYGFRLPGGATT